MQMPDVSFSAVNLPLLLSILALSVSVFSFVFLMFYIKRRTQVKVLQNEVLSGIRPEVNDILKSLDETTERDITLMEEQKKKLRNMLEETDKRLNVYIRELELRRNAENTYEELNPGFRRSSKAERSSGPKAPAADRPGEFAAGGSYQGSSNYLELGKNRYRINRQVLTQTAETPVSEEQPAVKGSSVPPKADAAPVPPSTGEQIRSLTRAGFSPPLIATRLGLSIAEVELAVALLERRES